VSQSAAKSLGLTLLGSLSFAGLLAWALLAPAAVPGRTVRPPLLKPVTLDLINETSVVPTESPAAPPTTSASDGLKAW
jgi:hypothetical protein